LGRKVDVGSEHHGLPMVVVLEGVNGTTASGGGSEESIVKKKEGPTSWVGRGGVMAFSSKTNEKDIGVGQCTLYSYLR